MANKMALDFVHAAQDLNLKKFTKLLASPLIRIRSDTKDEAQNKHLDGLHQGKLKYEIVEILKLIQERDFVNVKPRIPFVDPKIHFLFKIWAAGSGSDEILNLLYDEDPSLKGVSRVICTLIRYDHMQSYECFINKHFLELLGTPETPSTFRKYISFVYRELASKNKVQEIQNLSLKFNFTDIKDFRGVHSTAAQYGALDVLEYLIRTKRCDMKVVSVVAAFHGQIPVLEMLRREGFEFTEKWICLNAVKGSKKKVIDWAVEQGMRPDEECCTQAVKGDNYDMLLHLRSIGCPWDRSAWVQAQKGLKDRRIYSLLEKEFEETAPKSGIVVKVSFCDVVSTIGVGYLGYMASNLF